MNVTLKEILANKAEAIEMKKAEVKYCDPSYTSTVKSGTTVKASGYTADEDTDDVIKRTIVGNTYYYLDSHQDIHVKGCFTKSIKERSNKIFHLADHEYKLTAKIGEPTSIYEKEISWRDLGVDKAGITTALMMDTDIYRDYNKNIFNAYKNGQIDNHSVGMIYTKVDLAVNSDELEYKEEKATWNSLIESIANKEEAMEAGYFWVVRECKLLEISAVLVGSNPITPTLENKENQDIEPSTDTHINTQPETVSTDNPEDSVEETPKQIVSAGFSATKLY